MSSGKQAGRVENGRKDGSNGVNTCEGSYAARNTCTSDSDIVWLHQPLLSHTHTFVSLADVHICAKRLVEIVGKGRNTPTKSIQKPTGKHQTMKTF